MEIHQAYDDMIHGGTQEWRITMELIKWEDIRSHCPWLMVGKVNPDERLRCAAITPETGLCCSESMCAPWHFVNSTGLSERAAEHGVVKFRWACRCGHTNVWSWPMVEYSIWYPTKFECDKCGKSTMMKERPEVIYGCKWTQDEPVKK
jgi:hypothetical protein